MVAMSMAALIISSLLSNVLDTSPLLSASEDFIFLAVRQRSLTRLWLPITLGSLCRVPTSAASPMSTSFTQNQASVVHNLISVAVIRSTPAPTQALWMQQIIGLLHFSREVMKT